jgi:hypothetical protein
MNQSRIFTLRHQSISSSKWQHDEDFQAENYANSLMESSSDENVMVGGALNLK